MLPDDVIRLRHMLDAAWEATGFCAGRTRADLERNRQLLLAVIRDLEIVGDAATKVSAETIVAQHRIPWPDIIGMRHRLIHGYFDVDVEIVWNTVQIRSAAARRHARRRARQLTTQGLNRYAAAVASPGRLAARTMARWASYHTRNGFIVVSDPQASNQSMPSLTRSNFNW